MIFCLLLQFWPSLEGFCSSGLCRSRGKHCFASGLSKMMALVLTPAVPGSLSLNYQDSDNL